MKQFNILMLIFLFISCSNENHIQNIDKDIDRDIQVYNSPNMAYRYNNFYNGNNILKFKIQYNFIDSNYNGIDNDDYYVYVDAGYIENGKLTLKYNDIDEKYSNGNLGEYFFRRSNRLIISNNEAKILKIEVSNIRVLDHENKVVGILTFESYDCTVERLGIIHFDNPCSKIYFIYSTEETKINGELDIDIYDLELKKGWNKVYYYEDSTLPYKIIHSTSSENFPDKAKWKVMIIE
jgi:hypothetical protein